MKSYELVEKKVFIAPFSAEAIILYHRLVKDGIDVIAFLDKDNQLHNSSYFSASIFPYIHFGAENCMVIIAKSPAEKAIHQQLIDVGFKSNEITKDITCRCTEQEIVSDIDYSALYKIKKTHPLGRIIKRKILCSTPSTDVFILKGLVFMLTTRCTLKCKGCGSYIDHFLPHQQRDIEAEVIIKVFDILMKNIDYVDTISLYGGEPLLYKNIDKLLVHICDSDYFNKIGQIFLSTNGTVIPNSSTLELFGMFRDKITLFLSDYESLSTKKLKLVKALNRFECNYFDNYNKNWYLASLPKIPDLNSSNEEIAARCSTCYCNNGRLRIFGNKIFPCSFVMGATECNIIPYDRHNYLDTNEDDISKDVLMTFESGGFHPGKRYCSTVVKNKDRIITKAEQV